MKYVSPKAELVTLNTQDVICASAELLELAEGSLTYGATATITFN